jgi:hypothetical protein
MKRSGIKRGTKGLKRGKGLNYQSAKRRRERPVYLAAKREAFERDGGICVAAELVPHVPCWGALEPHHLAKQSTTPQGRNDPNNIKYACHNHHAWIGDNQPAAQLLGLHRSSWEYKATG